MTNEETKQVIQLLRQFWPKEKVPRPRQETIEIAIAPYDFEAVKNAIIAHARGQRGHYFPDVADLTAGVAPPETEKQETGRGSEEEAAWMKKYIFSDHHGLGRVSKYAREHGLTWDEAKVALAADPLEEVDWA